VGEEKVKSKFGVYIPSDLIQELDAVMKGLGIENRSKLFQEALRLFIVENKWSIVKNVTGSITILYNHEVGGVDEALTDAQHTFLDVIISTMHVHLDRERCMLIIAIKGSSERIKELLGKLHSIRGVMLIRHVLVEAQ
jgi:CopG family nickel-responsive transcriptional regulator